MALKSKKYLLKMKPDDGMAESQQYRGGMWPFSSHNFTSPLLFVV
jgi:hypothetical protein